jgi:hypothetical protein
LKIPKRGNQNPYIEEEQTTQWPKEKVQKDKQRSTKHTYKTKDRVTRTPLKTGLNPGAPEGWAVPAPLVAPVVLPEYITYNKNETKAYVCLQVRIIIIFIGGIL